MKHTLEIFRDLFGTVATLVGTGVVLFFGIKGLLLTVGSVQTLMVLWAAQYASILAIMYMNKYQR